LKKITHLRLRIEILARHGIIRNPHNPHVNRHFKAALRHVKIKNGMLRHFHILRFVIGGGGIDAKALNVCFGDYGKGGGINMAFSRFLPTVFIIK
jgi:hypothetical protein